MGQLYIDGKFKDASDGQVFEVLNPYTLKVIENQSSASEDDVESAIEGAINAFDTYKKTTAYERADLLRKLLSLMTFGEEEIAKIMTEEQGKPFAEALGEVRYAASYVRWYAEEAIRVKGDLLAPSMTDSKMEVTKVPVGPVGIITPWNFPLAMFVRKVAPALAAGCTVVVKPAEETPLTAVKFFQWIHEAGFPKGVCQLITGDAKMIGKKMLESIGIRKISFTGSTGVGQYLMEQSGATLKKLSLELGGHAPFIVFDDADIEAAVEGAIASKFRNCGQVCVATNRVYVQEAVYDEFLSKMKLSLSKMKVGDGFNNVDLGPMINEAGFEKVQDHVSGAVECGAKVYYGGEGYRAESGQGGFLYEPTLLIDVDHSMKVMTEETFGPVLPVMKFKEESEVIEHANNTPFGLAAYYYTNNLGRANRVSEGLDYGMIGLNTGRISAAQAPFGGVKMSGFGREGGSYGIEEYLVTKYVMINY